MRFGSRLSIVLGAMIAVLMLIGESAAQFSAVPKSGRSSASGGRPAAFPPAPTTASPTARSLERGAPRTAATGGVSQKTKSHTSQRDLSIARFRGDSLAHAAGLPGSGVYALHNAVDVPALGPDGLPVEASISRVLEARGDMIASKPFELNQIVEEEK